MSFLNPEYFIFLNLCFPLFVLGVDITLLINICDIKHWPLQSCIIDSYKTCTILNRYLSESNWKVLIWVIHIIRNILPLCRIVDVMVCALASSGRSWFKPRSNQPKDYEIGICCFPVKHAAVRINTARLGIRIMRPCGATCLLADCCFSK